MPNNSSASSQDHITVKGHFNALSDTYTREVLQTEAASTDPALNALVRQLIVDLEQFWRRLSSVGAFSANDEMDDYSTTALEMLWTPYMLGDLYQRMHVADGAAGPSAASAAQKSSSSAATSSQAATRMSGEEEQRRRDGGEEDANEVDARGSTSAAAAVSYQAIRETELRGLARQDVLARSHAWFKVYFEWMLNTELTDDKTIELYSVYRPDQRTQRIELSRTATSLRAEWRAAEDKVGYLRAKRRRMRELMEENGESVEEEGGEEEEALRDRALVRLRWSFYDACHQLQLSGRELTMLQALNPTQRATISAQYQETLDAVKRGEMSLGRNTYTILPGGMMSAGTVDHPQAVAPSDILQSGGVSLQAINAAGSQQLFRQQVREELMVDRNRPTMTLQEFAAMEMADISRQMEEAQDRQREQAEEDERIGADGIEERQRQKDSAWDNWKDDHPALGITNKGNYS